MNKLNVAGGTNSRPISLTFLRIEDNDDVFTNFKFQLKRFSGFEFIRRLNAPLHMLQQDIIKTELTQYSLKQTGSQMGKHPVDCICKAVELRHFLSKMLLKLDTAYNEQHLRVDLKRLL